MPRTTQGKFVTKASEIFQKGDDFWHDADYKKAKECYIRSASLYHETADAEGEAFALLRLGKLSLSLDEFTDAENAFNSVVELVKNEELAQNTYVDALTNISKLETARAQFLKAKQIIKMAQNLASKIGNLDLLGEAFDHEAYIYLIEENEKEALRAYKNAANAFHHDRTSLKEASVLRAIARIEMKNKNYDVAHDVLEECRNLYRENGDLLGEASALSAIGSLRYIIKDIENARKALMKSVYLYGKVSHHFAEAEALLYLARVEAFDKERGDFERSKAHYKRSIELFDFLGNDIMKKSVLDEYHTFLNRLAG